MKKFKLSTVGVAIIGFIMYGCAGAGSVPKDSEREICKTKYPIVLIHGVGFRDSERLKYWGRIPETLEARGATIYYGQQDGWGSIEHNAATLKDTIDKILAETNCGKVNIIAHSKGGLDARYMIASLGMADKVASLTTIATPHNGVKTMDSLQKLPAFLFNVAGYPVNGIFSLLGDTEPNFAYTNRQFTTTYMKAFNEQNPDAVGVYYQSYAAVMKKLSSDWLLLWPNLIVGFVEGENDGLVTPESAQWTNFRGVLRAREGRGVSHADLTDRRRSKPIAISTDNGDIDSIQDFYVGLVAELKEMGL